MMIAVQVLFMKNWPGIVSYRHFKFSILQTLPSNITKPEIDRIERLYKEKLGSRAHGLNGN